MAASFPTAASVTVKDGLTRKTYKLTNGAFTIPTGAEANLRSGRSRCRAPAASAGGYGPAPRL
jgi:hypothetical protein